MNIVYMHTHDSGRYWSPYGHALPTPNIQAFAEGGATLFRHAYCAGPTCSPSRAALLTGMTPHRAGMQGLAHMGWQLRDYDRHLAQFLGANGFHTALCGIQHEAPDYRMLGYDNILGSQEFDMGDTVHSMESFDHTNTDAACAFLVQQQGNATPFFLSLGLFNTHREFPKAREDNGILADYLAPPAPLYDNDINRRDYADYIASVKVVDDCFGKLLQTLERTGLAQDTLVVMTTDHGIAFPKMKCTLRDTGIGVALLIRLPGGAKQRRATDALVSHLDVFPTLCDAAGIMPPDWLEGTSLMPVMTGSTDSVRREIFAEVTYHAAYEPKRCIRTDRYKLIRRYDYHNGIVPANIDDCTSKDFLMDHGYDGRVLAREYLFDLWLDPFERENRALDSDYHLIYNDLSGRLEEWMVETDDPLINHGARVPKPAGARTIKLSQPSPRVADFEE
ncbi:MAG: sulfatase [Planctomycetaceae bacterium]|nr:sulfatase [Planctomycetaceae bacterium]